MKLYVFNPDTDMALASDEENYMAPASIRRMAQDLALLPVWYAQPGSAVLASSAYNADYLQKMKQLFPLSVQLVTEPELPDYAESQVVPWGWNRAFHKRMRKAGIAEHKLITEAELCECRLLSSRSYGMTLGLTFELPNVPKCVCGRHYMIIGDGEGESYSSDWDDKYKDGYLFKSLWSGSGRGLRWCRHGMAKSTADWCNREIAKYGAVVLEPIYKKVGDFAMEFYSNGRGKVLFSGYSRFFTDEKGAYRGNMLVSNAEVEQWILQYIPLEAFVSIREHVQEVISGIYGRYYSGPMGIDMMICPDQRGYPYAVHPHVEVNVRMTMGMVARQLYDNFVAPGSKGIFNVDNFPSAEALRAQHEQDTRDYPLVVEDGRIVSGYLSLVPVTPQSRYRAYVRVEVC
ncbi:hypothetical protein [Bacteroides timonensis]|uniref:hypothetical protein n=1 Tax=Bacteroides timonensis TaxID=1470345 RepID=UPI0004B1E718|nr:hypothetical protein [Bacteroides timonensis]